MRRSLLAAAAALLVSTTFVVAQPEQPGGLRTIQIDCMKQYGAWQDPESKRWKFQGTTDLQQKVDLVYSCVSQKTGRPAEPFMTQRELRRY